MRMDKDEKSQMEEKMKTDKRQVFRYNLRSLKDQEKYYSIFIENSYFAPLFYKDAKNVQDLKKILLFENPKDKRQINAYFNSLSRINKGDLIWICAGDKYALGEVKSDPYLSQKDYEKTSCYLLVDADFREIKDMDEITVKSSFNGGTAISKINKDEALLYSISLLAKKDSLNKEALDSKKDELENIETSKRSDELMLSSYQDLYSDFFNFYIEQIKLLEVIQRRVLENLLAQNLMLSQHFLGL